MENLVSSSSASLTSRSTESMEMDAMSVMENSPPRTSGSTRNTPLNETHNSLCTDTQKRIVVNAPSVAEMTDSSVLMSRNDDEEEDDEDDVIVTPYKRKRASVNYILDDSVYTPKSQRGSPSDTPQAKKRLGPKVRGVIIGVWRDSSEAVDLEKHVIFGFIDIHDRLRTRIYAMNRRGEDLIGNAPTGAGGCWVTFERIIFEPHLRKLSSAQIKEYVKIRSAAKPEATSEEKQEAEHKAVLRATAIASEDAANNEKKPSVRRSLGRIGNQRDSLPRQSLHKAPSFQAVNAADMQTPIASPLAEGKPSGVLLGYWAESSEPSDGDKHAVFGVLSGSDCFRVKVQRVTRDGRYVDGNFPIGPGAMWLHYDKVVLEPHLSSLTRAEVKEYCRLRNRAMENRESEKERKANELKAVREAKTVVATQALNDGHTSVPLSRAIPEMETRHSARSELKMQAKQQAEDEAEASRKRLEKVQARERQNEKTRKEVALAEAVIQDAAQQELKNNIKKLNKVWVAQQAATTSNGSSSVMMANDPAIVENEGKCHNGVKYERKLNGPFKGTLVSSAQILSIDGEDYVEYRVLTKPALF